ncbi:hypothetical protein PRK78_001992 [Emydomyces testavorans]|uniref:MFS general substrate transporter n=1 Tax=Emydomyces testavorans TaxID=2070801 RepID=A0AAF0IHE8_9EURO|nr:hypothetical protein PRK78_001992 [Emydomyces testavorans]
MGVIETEKDENAVAVTKEDVADEDFSDIDVKKVLRKMDLRLIPMLALLYLLSFLDRGNIGNARIEGLEKDLKLHGSQYNWCYLPAIMLAWGTVMTLMGLVKDYKGLLIARLFLGITGTSRLPIRSMRPDCTQDAHTTSQCGTAPRKASSDKPFSSALRALLVPFLAYWPMQLLYVLKTLFICQCALEDAAVLTGKQKMDGVGGYAGWRWIFILEGLCTVLVAAIAFFTIYDFPETAPFLTEREREFVVHRLKYQGSKPGSTKVAQTEAFEWKYVFDAFKDWQIYVSIIMFWGIVCPLYGLSLFLPSIIKDLGYRSSTAQLLTVPVYCTAAALAIFTAWVADKHGKRSPFILGYMIVIAIGFIICIASAGRGIPGVVYAGVFIAVCGIYPAFPGNVTWLSSNLAGSYKRATGMAIQIGAGNLSGVMASNFYRPSDAPKYYVGHGVELSFVVAGMIAVLVLRFSYQHINKKRDIEGTGNLTEEEMAHMGDKSPAFRYAL